MASKRAGRSTAAHTAPTPRGRQRSSTTRRTQLLDEPAVIATRRIALELLKGAEAARERLDDPDDAEALHDFRVAVRRLRSCLRAYRPLFEDTVRRGSERRLRRVSRHAGESRDIEVHIGLVKDASRTQRAGRRDGLRQLLDDLKAREARARSRLRKVVDRQFPRIVEELHRAFERYTASVNEPLPQLRTVLSATIRNHVDELELTLNRVHSVADRADAHAARIAAKRLRYLLEPLAAVDRTIARAVEKLTRLQDTLGTIHDAQTFAGQVAEAVALLADEDESSARKGLVHLSRRLHQMETAAFAVLQRGWLNAKRRPDIARVMSAMA